MFDFFQRLSNGSIDPDSDINRVIELQETVEKQNSELTNTRTKMLEINNKYTEMEESFTTAQKDLIKAQEQVVKLQRDLREVSLTCLAYCLCLTILFTKLTCYTTKVFLDQHKTITRLSYVKDKHVEQRENDIITILASSFGLN